MTNQQHPITPPSWLVQQWIDATKLPGCVDVHLSDWEQRLASQAARWGADMELEACCEWLKAKEWIHPEFSDELRATRRPKLPSLKEQALLLCNDYIDPEGIIRRALESLPS